MRCPIISIQNNQKVDVSIYDFQVVKEDLIDKPGHSEGSFFTGVYGV